MHIHVVSLFLSLSAFLFVFQAFFSSYFLTFSFSLLSSFFCFFFFFPLLLFSLSDLPNSFFLYFFPSPFLSFFLPSLLPPALHSFSPSFSPSFLPSLPTSFFLFFPFLSSFPQQLQMMLLDASLTTVIVPRGKCNRNKRQWQVQLTKPFPAIWNVDQKDTDKNESVTMPSFQKQCSQEDFQFASIHFNHDYSASPSFPLCNPVRSSKSF